eukprot:scaffold81088_cov23-Tisochrysis_lutea.AAC.1
MCKQVVGDLSFLHDINGLSLLRAGEARPPLTVVLVNNGGGGIFSFLPIANAMPEQQFTQLWATPQNVDLEGVRVGQWTVGARYRCLEGKRVTGCSCSWKCGICEAQVTPGVPRLVAATALAMVMSSSILWMCDPMCLMPFAAFHGSRFQAPAPSSLLKGVCRMTVQHGGHHQCLSSHETDVPLHLAAIPETLFCCAHSACAVHTFPCISPHALFRAGMCRAHGIPHQRASTPEEYQQALNSAWGLNRHSVVEFLGLFFTGGAPKLDKHKVVMIFEGASIGAP